MPAHNNHIYNFHFQKLSNNPNELGALSKSSSFINQDTTMTYYPKIPYS